MNMCTSTAYRKAEGMRARKTDSLQLNRGNENTLREVREEVEKFSSLKQLRDGIL